jgi:hypothetical protein
MNIASPAEGRLGSIKSYEKGGVETLTTDDPKRYCFSNVFEVAKKSAPYERIAVAVNQEYVLEAVRLEGVSPWYISPEHDETILVMEGEVRVDFVDPAAVTVRGEGARRLPGEPDGVEMGSVLAYPGNLVLLPVAKAYRFSAKALGAGLIQTVKGPLTIERWSSIVQLS